MNPAQTLISFAKHRRKAYKAYGQLTQEREKAVAEILRVAQFFLHTGKSGWVNQLQKYIQILMPSSESQDAYWIDRINQFINQNNNVTT